MVLLKKFQVKEHTGVHVIVENGEVETLYAHCKTIYVNTGDNVAKGQELGLTGATGNVTGPHLHFEIRRQERYINPDEILNF